MAFFKGNFFTKKKEKETTAKKKAPDRLRRQNQGESSPVLVDLVMLMLLIIDLYLLASLVTPWTGNLGYAVSHVILFKFGGAALIALLFFGYILAGRLFRRKLDRPFFQFLGTAALIFCSSLALGLKGLAGTPVMWRWMNPGMWGTALTLFLYRTLGPLGTTLIGLFVAFLSLVLFRPGVLLKIRNLPQKLHSFADRLSLKKIISSKKGPDTARGTDDGLSDDTVMPESSNPSEEGPALFPTTQVTRRKRPADLAVDDGEDFFRTATQELIGQEEGEEEAEAIPDGEDHLQELFRKEDLPAESFEEAAPMGQFPPPLDFFGSEEPVGDSLDQELIRRQGERIIQTLAEFGIEAELAEKVVGPTVVQFRLQLAPGIKVSRVASLNNDLAVALAVPSLRVEAPIPGKPYVGIEIPNPKRVPVLLRSVIESPQFDEGESELPLPLGQGVDGKPLVVGLEDLPHMLVAGTTGSGKSVFVNSCILGLCSKRRPEELRLLLVDPKRVEMSFYERLPHTLTPPIVDPKKAVQALAWAIREMERRYEVFARSRVRNLRGYNAKTLPKDRLSHIVIVIDELADLMMTSPKEVEDYICRLAQMARATGIHLMVATQRPSVNVITGLIKANIPARVAFTLPSQADSRTILDVSGAEKLLGKGDMLFLSPRYPKPLRIQAPWIDESRISALIGYLVSLFGEPEHIEIEEQSNGGEFANDPQLEDPMIRQAVYSVLESGIASASRLQRQLRVGFTRAARLVDAMETLGIVGPQEGSKPRDILVDEDRAEEILSRLDEE